MPDDQHMQPSERPATVSPALDLPRQRRAGRRIAVLGVLALPLVALGFGVWQHYQRYSRVMTTAAEHRDFIPTVRVAEVRASNDTMLVTLPATTIGFETANIYARATGYIDKRLVDIGSRVKAGDLLVEITAPELDDQIRQAEAVLAQDTAALAQSDANRELARVTSARSSTLEKEGWVTHQQGDTDRLNYQAQQQAAAVAEAAIKAQQAQLLVLRQEKAYQQVVAPFDGVVTQRNVDVGSFVQADSASGTPLFALVHSDVIRVQLYVPQDQAYGLKPGDDAAVHVPEAPGQDFSGTVARIADALQPGTRTLLTEIDVPNRDGTLRSGIYCTVQLKIPRRTPSLIVPSAAVIFDQSGLQVAVVEEGAIRLRKINVVRDLGTEVETDGGVASGEKVVLNPSVALMDGSHVRVRVESAAASP